jgi:hypothetical protein
VEQVGSRGRPGEVVPLLRRPPAFADQCAPHVRADQRIEDAANPIGVDIDPDYLLERLTAGDDPADLLRPGAGTRPGTTPRANKRAITWRTL